MVTIRKPYSLKAFSYTKCSQQPSNSHRNYDCQISSLPALLFLLYIPYCMHYPFARSYLLKVGQFEQKFDFEKREENI